MDTPYLELRETDDGFGLYKDGLSTGRVFRFDGEEIIDFTDEFFDLAVSGIPVGEKITIYPRFNDKKIWITWIDAVRDERYVAIDLYCNFEFSGKEDEEYVFNPKAIASKIMEQAWSHGFITDHLNEDDLPIGFRKRFSVQGTLRAKVKTALDILQDLKTKAENEVIESISKGELFIKIPDVDKMNPLQSFWLP